MTARRVPIFSTIVVLAAVATMIALGIWQLGRRAEKEALIARYEAAQAAEGYVFIKPSEPEAAYTHTIEYCASPESQSVVSGRNARGQTGWVHVARCTIGGAWPKSDAELKGLAALFDSQSDTSRRMSEAEVAAFVETLKEAPELPDHVLQPADVVLGWSREAEPVAWKGGFVAGTVVPTGELGFKIVADPPLAGLQPNAKPDPGDLPNNHLAYAGQWFFFALTALVIYVLALRRRRR
jgi:surfeit locus 1 family protein